MHNSAVLGPLKVLDVLSALVKAVLQSWDDTISDSAVQSIITSHSEIVSKFRTSRQLQNAFCHECGGLCCFNCASHVELQNVTYVCDACEETSVTKQAAIALKRCRCILQNSVRAELIAECSARPGLD
eukprot:jgi/Botrbrau1/6406/Bobra.49_1s0023.1